MSLRTVEHSQGLSAGAVSWLGVIADLALTVVKLAVGAAFRSQALLADGMHSGSDLVTDVAVLAGVRVSDKPADRDHHYGHRRVSTLVAMFVGAALLGAAGWIAYNAILSFRRAPAEAVRAGWPFWVALGAVPIKELLYQVTHRVGRRVDNASLVANAWHHRTDAISSLAAAAGLGGVVLGGPDWRFLDAVTATVLSAFLAVAAFRIMRRAAEELIDRAPAAAIQETIADAVRKTEGVRGYHDLRARQIGGRITADTHVLVDPRLTVREGHEIATRVRREVRRAAPRVIEVIVHVEPDEPPFRR